MRVIISTWTVIFKCFFKKRGSVPRGGCEDFTCSICGVAIACDYDIAGYVYRESDGVYVPDGSAPEHSYSFTFTMRLEE